GHPTQQSRRTLVRGTYKTTTKGNWVTTKTTKLALRRRRLASIQTLIDRGLLRPASTIACNNSRRTKLIRFRRMSPLAGGQGPSQGKCRVRLRNGKAPSEGRSSKLLIAYKTESTGNRRETQAQSLDLFGPTEEWSTAAEHWSFTQWQAINAILFNGNTDPH